MSEPAGFFVVVLIGWVCIKGSRSLWEVVMRSGLRRLDRVRKEGRGSRKGDDHWIRGFECDYLYSSSLWAGRLGARGVEPSSVEK